MTTGAQDARDSWRARRPPSGDVPSRTTHCPPTMTSRTGARHGPNTAASTTAETGCAASAGSSGSSTTRSARQPSAMAPAGRAERLRATTRRGRVERLPHRHLQRPRARCALARASRCDHSSWRNSAKGSMQVLESLPTPNAPPRIGVRACGESAVAEIGLGRRREPRDRAARGEAPRFVGGHVRRVHDAPARIESGVREQPFDRPRAAPRHARGDFAELFRRVNVDRRLARNQGDDRGELVRRHRAQTVRRDSEREAGRRGFARERRHDTARTNRRVCTNRRWPDVGATPPKSGVGVEHGQQRQRDARRVGGR